MSQNLTPHQWLTLIRTVFAPGPDDRQLLILVDVPNATVGDTPAWSDRRTLAYAWYEQLSALEGELPFRSVGMLYFENTGSNNADFPEHAYVWPGEPANAVLPTLAEAGRRVDFREALGEADVILAPTQFSATAPLKLLARELGFRAASMPGFSRKMIPALGTDYERVHAEVMKLKQRLDAAVMAVVHFEAEGEAYPFHLDLRFREAHASSGLLRQPGTAGNLPSGEAYIVPYEGGRDEPSRTAGLLPVQFGKEIVVYLVENNRALGVVSQGPAAESERRKIASEPAYGNIAELGFGVLARFGIAPVGEVLLDEKLGLHIAFGRSDHFGGVTGPQAFNDPGQVVHMDRIYIPQMQDRVHVERVELEYADRRRETIMRAGGYAKL